MVISNESLCKCGHTYYNHNEYGCNFWYDDEHGDDGCSCSIFELDEEENVNRD